MHILELVVPLLCGGAIMLGSVMLIDDALDAIAKWINRSMGE